MSGPAASRSDPSAAALRRVSALRISHQSPGLPLKARTQWCCHFDAGRGQRGSHSPATRLDPEFCPV